jgi:DNA adenine methylase/adenine-specific DNA-methyltransferase
MATTIGVEAPSAPFPRLRYMGSKYRLLPALTAVFRSLEPFDTVLDAFSGSAVVAHSLKLAGHSVTTNDFLQFAATVARATVQNDDARLTEEDVATLTGPPADDRDFIRSTFRDVYFDDVDNAFLDSAWSHIARLDGHRKDLAVAALCLASARKQPRGVFSFVGRRYDDGRRQLHTPLRTLFVEAVRDYNDAVVCTGRRHVALCGDVFAVAPAGFDVVYLDPPYAPPRDDNCYMKRYHFLEGLSVYWEGQRIMEHTATKKLPKPFTPFSYKHTIGPAVSALIDRFQASTIVMSYGSNALPALDDLLAIFRQHGRTPEVTAVDHRYSFGTRGEAQRREAVEYIIVAR